MRRLLLFALCLLLGGCLHAAHVERTTTMSAYADGGTVTASAHDVQTERHWFGPSFGLKN